MEDSRLLETLKRYFGYTAFRPQQEEIIKWILSGRDCLVLIPTGGGKSLCYQIPSLLMEGITVVISPLISLMKDQVDALKAAGLPAAALNSALDEEASLSVVQDCLHGHIKLLYMSPENALARSSSLFQKLKINLFAVDEAHCVSHWGHDFRPDYAQLHRLHKEFPAVPMAAFTASADKVTRLDILKQLDLQNAKVFISSFDRPNIRLSVIKGMVKKNKDKKILAFIGQHRNESGIVYCLSRKTVEATSNMLVENGVACLPYHAGLSAEMRDRIQENFVHDRVQVICATVAFGMGIDKSNIRWIIHYNLPKSIENFYQEIGRAGRDGMPADTLLFYNYGDVVQLSSFAHNSGQTAINMERLHRMQEYAEAVVCRRRILLNYFGETSSENCGNCDVCANPPKTFNGTILAQKALSAIARTKEKAGFSMLTDVLRGVYSTDIKFKGFDKIKTFGVGRDVPVRDWHDYLLQMLQMGLFEIAYDENNHLKLTEQGREVLFHDRPVQLCVVENLPVKPKAPMKVQRGRLPQSVVEQLNQLQAGKKEEDEDLFEALRLMRRQIADRLGYSPYMVFTDNTLHEMARTKPQSIEAFGEVSGIGTFKCKKYGAEFLATIKRYCKR